MHKDHVAAHDIVAHAIFFATVPAIQSSRPAYRVPKLYFPENWEDMEGPGCSAWTICPGLDRLVAAERRAGEENTR